MIDFSKYNETSIPLPHKTEFYISVSAIAPSGKVHKVLVFEDGEYRKAMNAYTNAIRNQEISFRIDLLEELGITDHPKADLLFDKAWEFGHADSYRSVFNWACALVDLLRD